MNKNIHFREHEVKRSILLWIEEKYS